MAFAKRNARMTLAEFGALIGADEKTVRTSIANGRLQRGIARDGRGAWTVVDAKLAALDWEQNRDESKVRREPRAGETTADARREQLREQTRKLRLANDLREGTLVVAKDARDAWIALVVEAKTAARGIPSKAKQRLPHLTVADVLALEELVAEVLEHLAEGETP